MGYVLGVDLGTTYSAAAVAQGDQADRFSLGNRTPAIPSVVCLRADGEVLVGEAAERRALTEPGRTAREFKRRLGDPTPLILGGTPYGAETLSAHLLSWIVAKVTEQQGTAPDAIVVSHPANWGPYKLELLTQTVQSADVGPVTFITEPVAAAIHYARGERLEDGQVVAVYDFGGGTFDAAVLRKTGGGFELIGQPEGLERIGGIDFDQAIFAHVDNAIGGAISELDPNDTTAVAAVQRLREECQLAKEQLSQDTDVDIPVLLPGTQTEVRLTRSEFESMIRPRVTETISSLERAVRSAGIGMDDVAKVLLVGGSSRIPLVGQMVRESTGRPIAIDAHPKFAIAIGAALTGATGITGTSPTPVPASPGPAVPDVPDVPVAVPAEPVAEPAEAVAVELPAEAPEPAGEVPVAATTVAAAAPGKPTPTVSAAAVAPDAAGGGATGRGDGGRPPWIYAAAAVVAVLVVVGLTQVLGGGDGDVGTQPSPSPSEEASTDPSPGPSEPAPTSTFETLPNWVDYPDPDSRFVELTDVSLRADGRIIAEYSLYNAGASDTLRFFFGPLDPKELIDPVTEASAAEGEIVPVWADHTGAGFFEAFTLLDRPLPGRFLCALVLNESGDVPVDGDGNPYETGSCQELEFEDVAGDLLPGNRFVELTNLENTGSRYVLDFVTRNFTPSTGGNTWHVHAFWSPTQSKDWVGTNVRPNTWTIWTTSDPIDTGYFDVANRPADATHICVVVAQADHTILLQEDGTGYPSGTCLPLDPEAA